MIKKTNKKSGLTFIEILIYTSLLSVILGLISSFFYQAINFKVLNQQESSFYQNSQLMINKITQDLRKTQSVVSPGDENFADILTVNTAEGQVTYQVSEGRLERNGMALTDAQVSVITGDERGFRKIGRSIQLKLVLKANIKSFGQPIKTREYQTTIFLPASLAGLP